jgi:hypothetical protein
MADTIELMSALPVMYAGQYELQASLTSPVDSIIYDNTLFYSYASGRIGLPIEDDFNSATLSSNFIVTPVIGSEVWTPYIDQTSPVQPISGSGMLRYVGRYGTMSQFSIRQLDLNGSINPKLEFWYYHDTTASNMDRSYTDVNIIADNVSTKLLSLFRKDTARGWKQYTIDLTAYTNKECVLIEFTATNKFGTQSAQYIDMISITSMPDLALSDIIISPEISVCSMENKNLSIVITTVTNQAIDFSLDSTRLAVEVPGYSTFIVPLQGIIRGNTSNTVLIAPDVNIAANVSAIKAYLTSPVDKYPANDTITLNLDIRPELSVTLNPVTRDNACVKIGSPVAQQAIIRNIGNMDVSGIKLILRVTGDNATETINESQGIDLPVGDTVLYSFVNMYTAPADAKYQVQIKAYMDCDSSWVNADNAIEECADIHNIAIENIVNPGSQADVIGSVENIVVAIKNESDNRRYSNVTAMAVIENEQGEMLSIRMGTIPMLEPLATEQINFTESYTVPNDSVYYIRIYLNSMDIYPEDDTLKIKRHTKSDSVSIESLGEAATFTLNQNIPNPANGTTRINYTVPEAGQVIFHVHSISGQLLYSKIIEAPRGNQSIELNTAMLSAGVYYYSMEYKGQRIVKRMSVR